MDSIHSFKVKGIEGETIDLARFAGKKIIVVNVASECGFTPQYAQLQELYEEFKEQLVIIGFPSNDFGGQEPGDNEEIKTFCQRRYGVTFPLAAKVHIQGENAHELFRWLSAKTDHSKVSWNFFKYLIDEAGQPFRVLSSSVSPFDDVILDWLNS